MDAFERELERLVLDGYRSDGDNVLGMAMDVDHFLSELDEIDSESIMLEFTEHNDRLISVRCRAARHCGLGDAVAAVCDVWLRDLRYAFSELHRTTVSSREAVFVGVTQIGGNSLWVTLRVEVLAGE